MSGRPNYEEVKTLAFYVSAMARAESFIDSSSRDLERASDALKKARQEYADAKREVFLLLDKMDVQANGNDGYDQRMSAFLIMLRAEIERNAPRPEPVI